MEWTIQHHPAANTTTLKVARDVADRMPDSKDGHVAYALASMHQRLGLARSTVSAHIAILRELGLLCWVEHGSRRNALRTRLGDRFTAGTGYRPTATIYAPCAPPEVDRARGRVRGGAGYRSRICAYTPAGRIQAVAEARHRQARRTPSFGTRTTHAPAGRREGSKDSATLTRRPAAPTRPRTRTRNTSTFTPQQAAAGITFAGRVRLEIWWTQGTCLRQLGYALRPLITAGYTWQETARELSRWSVTLRPANAAALIHAELRRRANTGLLHLPSGTVKPYRQVPADESAERHDRMIEHRWQRYGPAFTRYRQTLAAPLRAALQQLTSRLAPRLPRPRPQLREPEDLFTAAHSPSTYAPRDTYRARAWGAPVQSSTPTPRGGLGDRGAWAELAEHAQAAAAFQRLREDLAATRHSGTPAERHPHPCL
ncbi:winged helix-turn-helix domain-containing protein [Streptomyces kronopolitis]|uniref:helix-turn-helix domain-containing protein n=1 Tax=Streptomyces kronopolitis TaxID=1612435 RepID=UPI0036B36164